jgi:hypothetical protein
MAQVIGPGLHIRELGHRALQIVSPQAERLVSRDPGCRRLEPAADRQFRYPEGVTGKLLPIGSTISDFIFLLRKAMPRHHDAHSVSGKRKRLQ